MLSAVYCNPQRGPEVNHNLIKLEPGLYLVATPLGSARDITLRALDILASADVLAAEDTRTARKLLDIHGVPLAGRRIIAYHDHSQAKDRQKLLQHVVEGKSVAYVSEAGTPLIADPGYQLVADARREGLTSPIGAGTCGLYRRSDCGRLADGSISLRRFFGTATGGPPKAAGGTYGSARNRCSV